MVGIDFSRNNKPTKTAVELSHAIFGDDILDRPGNSQGVDKANDTREQLHKEVLSMNVQYLDSIHALINQYILSAFKGDLDISLNALALLCELMSPKVDIEAEEEQVEKLEIRLSRSFIKDGEGQIIRVNPAEITAVKQATRKVFKAILKKIDMVGMLTMMPKDYKTVMGDFSNS